MRTMIFVVGLGLTFMVGGIQATEQESSDVMETEKSPYSCDASEYTMCMARELDLAGVTLDHTEVLGYSGAAFRIHALPREVLCPSTVSPRYGYKIQTIAEHSCDVISALRQARTLAEPGLFGEYLSGVCAYDLWIRLLEADDESGFMQHQTEVHAAEDAGLPILNRYCFLSLLHARAAAGPFLRRRALELGGPSAQCVEQAADCYDQVVVLLERVGEPVWSSEVRKKQAGAMRAARDLELKAATLIREALADLSVAGHPSEP